jgi:hypothetical protein
MARGPPGLLLCAVAGTETTNKEMTSRIVTRLRQEVTVLRYKYAEWYAKE